MLIGTPPLNGKDALRRQGSKRRRCQQDRATIGVNGQLVLATLQPVIRFLHGRFHLFLVNVAKDVQIKPSMIGIALGAKAFVLFAQDVNRGMFQPMITAYAVDCLVK
jgi:hypothetical protein